MKQPEPTRRLPGRREFVALGAGAFAVAFAPRVLRPGPHRTRRAVPVMGTIAEIAVVHGDKRHANAAIDAALAALTDVERAMTRFRDDSDIGRANLLAASRPVPIGTGTATVVAAALDWADRTDGAFDPAVGRVVELWDVANRSQPPRRDAVVRLAGQHLHRAVELGKSAGQPVLVYRDDVVALDLGGIAKGHGVDRAVTVLRDWGIRNAIVNVGGDLFAMGASEDGDPWRVGIRSPDDPSRLIGSLDVADRAVATSGDYQQFFDHDGRRYHHLIDPRTGEPRRNTTRTLTIAADDCMTADAAATALFGRTASTLAADLRRLQPGASLLHAG